MKVFIFTLVLFSGAAFTEVDIVTLDDFSIYNVNEHDLVIAKNGKTDRGGFLGFRMERPFCICSGLVLTLKKRNAAGFNPGHPHAFSRSSPQSSPRRSRASRCRMPSITSSGMRGKRVPSSWSLRPRNPSMASCGVHNG